MLNSSIPLLLISITPERQGLPGSACLSEFLDYEGVMVDQTLLMIKSHQPSNPSACLSASEEALPISQTQQ